MRFPLWWRKQEQLNEEIQSHLQMAIRDRIERGESPEDAGTNARREFGNAGVVREVTRDRWGGRWFEDLLQDLRYGARMLHKNPGFTAVAVLTLALGIGANTAIFSVIDAVLLRSLPYPDANRLVILGESLPRSPRMNVSLPDFLDWRAQNRTFEEMAAYAPSSLTLTGSGEPTILKAAFVSSSFFSMVGAKPILGRTFSETEDKPGANSKVVVSYPLWRDKLKEDPDIVGKTIVLDGYSFEVEGVLPRGFRYAGLSADAYTQIGPLAAFPGYADRSNHPGIQVLARLRPGVSFVAARADIDTIMGRLSTEYPKSNRGETADITPLYKLFLGKVQRILFLLLGAAGLVLLLACANVANLCLARANARRKELALRTALGASRRRLVCQLLTESLLLSLIGGTAGSLLSFWAMKPLLRLAPQTIPNIEGVQLNPTLLLFTLVAAAIAGVLFGLAPSLNATRLDLNRSLKEGGGIPTGPVRQRLRSVLLVAEVAVALVVIVASGLLIRSLSATLAVDPGFNPDYLLALDVNIPGAKVGQAYDLSFFGDALDRVRHLPGVRSAAAAMEPPMAGFHWTSPYMVEGQPALPPSERPWTAINMVTPDYFRTLQTQLLEGRFFRNSDIASAALVAIINRTLARRLWPHESAIGKRIYAQESWREVVGVVGDLNQIGLTSPPWPETFLPAAQFPVSFMTIVVRTEADPVTLAHSATQAIQSVEKDQPVSRVVPMTEYIAGSVEDQRFVASLFGLFGALALLLAAVGIYGVTAYSVTQRTHEIGIRLALGARPRDVLRRIVATGARLALAGIAIGVVAALMLTRLITNLLFGVTATDPLVFTGIAILLFGITLAACYIPARRAMRVDPTVALRYE